MFIPERLHLIEGKELVHTILQQHEKFLQTVSGIPLSGLTYSELLSKQPETNFTIRELIQNIKGVISVEQLRDRTQTGRCLVLITITMEQQVMKQLESIKEELYKCQKGQARIIIAGSKKIHLKEAQNNSVLTYAEILSHKYQSVIKQTNKSTKSYQQEHSPKIERILEYKLNTQTEVSNTSIPDGNSTLSPNISDTCSDSSKASSLNAAPPLSSSA